MHRSKTLRDADVVPSDTVDLGEQDKVDDVSAEEGLDLSYLWVVDARTLGRPPSPSSDTKRSKEKATDANNRSDRVHGGSEGSQSGAGDAEREEVGRTDAHNDSDADETATTKAIPPMSHDATDGHDRVKTGDGTRGKHDKGDACRADSSPDEENVPTAGAGDEGGGSHTSRSKPDFGGDGDTGGRGHVVTPASMEVAARGAGVAAVSHLRDEKTASGSGAAAAAAFPQKEEKKVKKRMIPGSLLLSKISASDLPDTEKGIFSKQVKPCCVSWLLSLVLPSDLHVVVLSIDGYFFYVLLVCSMTPLTAKSR